MYVNEYIGIGKTDYHLNTKLTKPPQKTNKKAPVTFNLSFSSIFFKMAQNTNTKAMHDLNQEIQICKNKQVTQINK